MATSSYPAVRDYLYEQIRILPACTDAKVSDGWPLRDAALAVEIGVTPDGSQSDADVDWSQLGAMIRDETILIPIVVRAFVVGGSRETVKAARDNAFAVFNGIITFLGTPNTGMTMGGILQSEVASVIGWTVNETGSSTEAGAGRKCEIYLSLQVKNRFQP